MSQAIVKEEEGDYGNDQSAGMGPEVEKFLIHNEINLSDLWNDTQSMKNLLSEFDQYKT